MSQNAQFEILTHSPQALPVTAFHFGHKGPRVLILGGVHGDEIEGIWAAQKLLSLWTEQFSLNLRLTLIPIFNPDGVFKQTRVNSRGVDLNRNLKTKDWSPEIKTARYHPGPSPGSEPENQALMKLIESEKPVFILSLHSWQPVLNVNGDCLAEAEVLSRLTGYKIDSEIGYPTPGCLGTYAGLERNSPTLTYEIERGLSAENIFSIHIPAILECLKVTEGKK
jgi:protein MpaA